jgi:signal transduction histidine kinase
MRPRHDEPETQEDDADSPPSWGWRRVDVALIGALSVLALVLVLPRGRNVIPTSAETVLLIGLLVAVMALTGVTGTRVRIVPAVVGVLLVVLLMRTGTGVESQFFYLLVGLAVWHGISLAGRARLVTQTLSALGFVLVWVTDPDLESPFSAGLGRFLGLLASMGVASLLGQELRRSRDAAEALAAERGMLLARLDDLRDLERRQLASDLHDGIVQGLASSVFEIVAARRCASAGKVEEGIAGLHRAEAALEAEIAALRTLMFDLWPRGLESIGIAAGLSEALDRFTARTGVDTELELLGDHGALDPPVARVLYRAHQEALENVRKHAGATHVRSRLVVGETTVLLEVVDDGVGFYSQLGPPAGHIGLVSLQERARQLNGSATIDSSAGSGCRVRVTVPLPMRAKDSARAAGAMP